MLEFDFEVHRGAFHLQVRGVQEVANMGLFGPSGCGKTTVLNCLSGLLRPKKGFICLDGKVLFDSSAKHNVRPSRREIGYVFQDGRLFPHMSVGANIEYGRHRRSEGPSIRDLSESLDLGDSLERLPDTLSAGQKQRVGLARALAAWPKLLLLDEPLASLDEESRLRILGYLKRVYKRWQIPFVYVSHSLTEILFLSDMTWQMTEGRITRSAHPRELLARSPHYVDPILNILTGTVLETPKEKGFALVRSGDQQFKVPPNSNLHPGDTVIMALPARDLIVAVTVPHGISARNVFAAKVVQMEQNGHALWLTAQAAKSQLVVELTADAGRELNLHTGMSIHLVVKSHSITVSPIGEFTHHEQR